MEEEKEIKTETNPTTPKRSHSKKPEAVKAPAPVKHGDGKVSMKKNGVGRRFAETRIKELEKDGWELVK